MSERTETATRRLPRHYLPAAYLEAAPKLIGGLSAGAIAIFAPGVWPGAWAWLALGPLISVLALEPAWRWAFTRITLTPTHLVVRTGAVHRREQTLAWTDVGTVDSRQPWAFVPWRLRAMTLSQAGDERTKVSLWAADDALHHDVTASIHRTVHAAQRAVSDGHTEAVGDAKTEDLLLYRARIGQLLLASVVYGQFALIGGGAAMAFSEWLQTFSVDKVIAGWIRLTPAAWAFVLIGVIGTLGVLLTVFRYANFEVRRAGDGRLVISYGLLSTHVRSVSPQATIGVVLQRNIVETALGRVRLSLLTTDSAAQAGTNLVLPSLPRRSVERLLHEAFGENPSTPLLTADRGLRAVGTGVAVLASISAAAVLAGWTTSGWGWSPALILAAGGFAIALVWPASRVLCSRLHANPESDRVALLISHLVQRQTILSAGAVHVIATTRFLSHPLLVCLSYYAGMPRTFRAPLFSVREVDALSTRMVRGVPPPRTRRRP